MEVENNIELYEYLKNKYTIKKEPNMIFKCQVVIMAKVINIKEALNIADIALHNGIEIICIKQPYNKCGFVSNLLIKEGAISV